MSEKNIVLSGVQPTGNLHLGNYLGAIKNFVSLQKEIDCIYCVVDLHAITTFQKPNELLENVLETTASFLATGINPSKSIIFNQSSFFLIFWNSSVPIAEIVFSDKNLRESGLGVASVCIMIDLYYIRPTFSRIFFKFSSAILLAFSLPFFKILFK